MTEWQFIGSVAADAIGAAIAAIGFSVISNPSSSSYSVYGHTRCYRPQHTIRTTAIRRIRFSLCIIHRSIFYRASQPFFCLQALLPGHGTLHTGIVTDDTGNVCLSHCIFSYQIPSKQ